jgi:hypothetical protein
MGVGGAKMTSRRHLLACTCLTPPGPIQLPERLGLAIALILRVVPARALAPDISPCVFPSQVAALPERGAELSHNLVALESLCPKLYALSMEIV